MTTKPTTEQRDGMEKLWSFVMQQAAEMETGGQGGTSLSIFLFLLPFITGVS
ncbi:hypothetical protein YC2023_050592 [Brassica napus]